MSDGTKTNINLMCCVIFFSLNVLSFEALNLEFGLVAELYFRSGCCVTGCVLRVLWLNK